jgi:nucleotide-binding universal stress UspA family protein
MPTVKNLLVAVDFSEPSQTALQYARELAPLFGARLHVLHVMSPPFVPGAYGPDFAVDFTALQNDIESAARAQLNATVSGSDRDTLGARVILTVDRSPAAAILAYAKDAEIDLIVLGTHGRGGMAHLLLGSVAERVVRLSRCPVLTVRPQEHEFVEPVAARADVTA